MRWLKAYGLRFVDDVVGFAEACLLSLATALPLVVLGFWGLFPIAYVPMVVISAMSIFVISGVTALFDSYRWRFAIYCTVLGAVLYLTADEIFERFALSRASALASFLAVQVVFGMGIFYYVLHRKRIAERRAASRLAASERREARL